MAPARVLIQPSAHPRVCFSLPFVPALLATTPPNSPTTLTPDPASQLREPQHMWLAEEALCLDLPFGWRAYVDRHGHEYYYNELLELRQWQHPKLSYLIALLRTFQQRQREQRQRVVAALGLGAGEPPRANAAH